MEILTGPVAQLNLAPRWALRPDFQPSIPPNSEVLLFIHGMDSRAEEADDITKAIFTSLPAEPPALVPLPPIPANRSSVGFPSPEACDHPDNFQNGQRTAVVPFDTVNGAPVRLYYAPVTPPELLDMAPAPGDLPPGPINVPAAHNIGANEGRLVPALRIFAQLAQPAPTLTAASLKFAAGDVAWGNAFADLSVTGRRSFEAFRQLLPAEPFCQSLIGRQPAGISPAAVVNGCHAALDRAYRVANF
jgi:hypothetical protein